MTAQAKLELAMKVIATAIACFGIWKYFSEKEAAAELSKNLRAISYIDRFAAPDMVQAREWLFEFWSSQEKMIARLRRDRMLTANELENFVSFAVPRYENRADLQAALFLIDNVFDQAAHCRSSGACNSAILDSYFCEKTVKMEAVYGPFYDFYNIQVASSQLGGGLKSYASACKLPSS